MGLLLFNDEYNPSSIYNCLTILYMFYLYRIVHL
jgi:hypothetical protein